MDISKLDMISPKISLYFNKNNSHSSKFGGLLSIIMFLLSILVIIFYLIQFIYQNYQSLLIYDQYLSQNINITLNNSSINHYITISKGNLTDIDIKNIIIYGTKNDNDNINNTEYWLYETCPNKVIFNLCLKYYYNPDDKKFYKIGDIQYKDPFIKNNDDGYKIIIEKCNDNNALILNELDYCTKENTNYDYIQNISFTVFFSDNQINHNKFKSPIENYYYPILLKINNKKYYYENNVIYSILKFYTNSNNIFSMYKEKFYYAIKNNFQLKTFFTDNENILAIINIYLSNKITICQQSSLSLLYFFSFSGGIIKFIHFLLNLLNYFYYKYQLISDTNTLISKIYLSKNKNNESPINRFKKNFSKNTKLKCKQKLDRSYNNLMKDRRSPSLFGKKYKCKKSLDVKPKTHHENEELFSNRGNKDRKINNKIQNILNIKKHGTYHSIYKNSNKLINNSKTVGNNLIIANKKTLFNKNTFPKMAKLTTISKNDKIIRLNIPKKRNNIRTKTCIFPQNMNQPSNTNKLIKLSIPKTYTPTSNKDLFNTKRVPAHIQEISKGNPRIFESHINNLEIKNRKNSPVSKVINHRKQTLEYIDSSSQDFINNSNSYDLYNKLNVYQNSSIVNVSENITERIHDLDISEIIKKDFNNKKKHFLNISYENKKLNFKKYFQSLFVRNERFIDTINILEEFRKKLLSEERLYKEHLELFLLRKYFEEEYEHKEKYDIRDIMIDI